jgi:hypothetical protein
LAALFHMGLPQRRGQVLWCASDRGHCPDPAVVRLLIVVFRFPEIDKFDLKRRQQKQVGRLEVSMRNADALEVTQGANNTDNHLLKLLLSPEQALLFPFAKHVLQVLSRLHELANHCDSESIVHSLIKVVAIKLQHVWVCLHLEQLYCFFLNYH